MEMFPWKLEDLIDPYSSSLTQAMQSIKDSYSQVYLLTGEICPADLAEQIDLHLAIKIHIGTTMQYERPYGHAQYRITNIWPTQDSALGYIQELHLSYRINKTQGSRQREFFWPKTCKKRPAQCTGKKPAGKPSKTPQKVHAATTHLPLMTPSGLSMGTILKMKHFLRRSAMGSLLTRNSRVPFITQLALLSPGWTRAIRKTYGRLSVKQAKIWRCYSSKLQRQSFQN